MRREPHPRWPGWGQAARSTGTAHPVYGFALCVHTIDLTSSMRAPVEPSDHHETVDRCPWVLDRMDRHGADVRFP